MGIEKIRKIFVLTVLFLVLSIIVVALQFTDNTQSEFNQGTYINTSYNGSSVILNQSYLSGQFLSQIFDSGSNATWNNITYNSNEPESAVLYGVDGGGEVFSSSDLGLTWSQEAEDYGRTSDTEDMFSDSINIFLGQTVFFLFWV